MKSIYETLAALGAGAILLGGCAGAAPEAKSAETPAAVETTPAAEGASKEATSGDAAASDKPVDNAAAMPADTAAASATPAPSTSASATAAAKAPAKAGTAAKKGTGKKKDAAGSCGEGTCG